MLASDKIDDVLKAICWTPGPLWFLKNVWIWSLPVLEKQINGTENCLSALTVKYTTAGQKLSLEPTKTTTLNALSPCNS